MIVLAFETSGPDLDHDPLLAAGWVLVRGGRLVMASAREMRLPDESPERVVRCLLPELAGRALVAHEVTLASAILDAALHRIGGVPMPNPWIGTRAVEQHLAAVAGTQRPLPDGELLLDSCRGRHNLPERSSRSAGADAVACAELLLAQVSRLGGPGQVKLRQLGR